MNTSKKPVKMGIVGLGFAGSVLMAPELRDHPDVDLIAACDPNMSIANKFAADYDVKCFSSLSEMADTIALDAVYIAVPHQYHADAVVEAAERNLHIIVEKPLTIRMEDADRIVEAVERAGVKAVVGPTRGNDPVVKKMRQIIASGDFGALSMINCWNYTDFLYRPRRPEELDTLKGGGIVFNQLPHHIELIKALSGQEIVAVYAKMHQLDPRRPTEGSCLAYLTLSNGVVASLVYSGYDHFDSDELQFWVGELGNQKTPRHGSSRKLLGELGDKSEAEYRVERYGYGGPIARAVAESRGTRKQAHFGIYIASCTHADLRPSPEGVLVYSDAGLLSEVEVDPTRGHGGAMDTTIEELVDAIRGDAPILRDVRWGRNTVEVCLAMLRSSRLQREVTL